MSAPDMFCLWVGRIACVLSGLAWLAAMVGMVGQRFFDGCKLWRLYFQVMRLGMMAVHARAKAKRVAP